MLIVSNRGTDELEKALRSVIAQDYRGPLHVAVIGDNSRWHPDELARHTTAHVLVEGFIVSSGVAFRELPTTERVSRLRNAALAFVRGYYLCFLDDDNQWETDHLSTLVNTLETSQAVAAHSWRQLFDRQGNPWFPQSFPWACDDARRAHLFQIFCEAGVMSPRSHVFRDTTELVVEGTAIGAVDMGAWLFKRSIFDHLSFETEYSDWEVENSVTEDDKLLSTMKTAGLPLVCSERATLRYTLGGYSNRKGEPR